MIAGFVTLEPARIIDGEVETPSPFMTYRKTSGFARIKTTASFLGFESWMAGQSKIRILVSDVTQDEGIAEETVTFFFVQPGCKFDNPLAKPLGIYHCSQGRAYAVFVWGRLSVAPGA